jgi:hypothetical protein
MTSHVGRGIRCRSADIEVKCFVCRDGIGDSVREIHTTSNFNANIHLDLKSEPALVGSNAARPVRSSLS